MVLVAPVVLVRKRWLLLLLPALRFLTLLVLVARRPTLLPLARVAIHRGILARFWRRAVALAVRPRVAGLLLPLALPSTPVVTLVVM